MREIKGTWTTRWLVLALGIGAFAIAPTGTSVASSPRAVVAVTTPSGPDFLIHPRAASRMRAGTAPAARQTSEFMAGDVVYSVIFVESSGGQGRCSPADPETEDWGPARRTKVLSEIRAGFRFWTSRSERPTPLRFSLDDLGTSPTSCEPISHGFDDIDERGKWIADVLTAEGFPATAATHVSAARDLVDARRDALGADWGILILVVDSLHDPDGTFADGRSAAGDLNGPMQYLTYDNGSYGIQGMNRVSLHETGHNFGALDEYRASGCSTADSWGYLDVRNGSCNNDGITTDVSVMGEASELFDPAADVSRSAREAIGWRNPSGPNGSIVDVVRTSTVSLRRVRRDPTTDATPKFTAVARERPFPPGGCNTVGDICYRQPTPVTISTVRRARWRLEGGPWTTKGLRPTDGTFHGEQKERYTFTPLAPVAPGRHRFSTRASNRFGHTSGVASDRLSILR